ncbi:MAG TPA: WG repeat-containing protein [Bacteroidia bacterium]|nr:WG repeat-containing protein [Bacteroidia bacterium]
MNRKYRVLFITIIFYFLFETPLLSQTIIQGSVTEILKNVEITPSDIININIEINGTIHYYTIIKQGEFKFTTKEKVSDDDQVLLSVQSKIYVQVDYYNSHFWRELKNQRIVIHLKKNISIPVTIAHYKKPASGYPPQFNFNYSPNIEININIQGVQSIVNGINKIELQKSNPIEQNFSMDSKRIADNIKNSISEDEFGQNINNTVSLIELFDKHRMILDSLNALKDLLAQYDKYLQENNRKFSKRLDSLESIINSVAFWGEKINNTEPLIKDSLIKYHVSEEGKMTYSGKSLIEAGYEDIIFPPKEGISRYYKNDTKKYGFINVKTKESISSEQYDYAEDFNDGLALISNKSKYDFIDHSGRLAFHSNAPGHYDYDLNFLKAISFKSGRALVYDMDSSWYFIDTINEKVSREIEKINFVPKEISDARWDININYVWIKYGYYSNTERNFLINKSGKRVSKLYHNIIGFNDSLVCIVNEDYRWTIIDSTMTDLLRYMPYPLDSIFQINDYLFSIRKFGNKNLGIISCVTKIESDIKTGARPFGIIDADFKYSHIIPAFDNIAIVEDTLGRYGVIKILTSKKEIDKNQRENILRIIQNRFDSITLDERTNQFHVMIDNLSWVVNSNGTIDDDHSESSTEKYKKFNH